MTEADCSACAQCGKPFKQIGGGPRTKFCGKECSGKAYRQTEKWKARRARANIRHKETYYGVAVDVTKEVIRFKCGHCESEFLANTERKFCSRSCYHKNYNKTEPREFKCAHCGVKFHTSRKRKFCNKACVEQAKRLREGTKTFAEEIEERRQRSNYNFNCEHCGKAFHRIPGGQTIKNGSRTRWCSMRCKKDATVKRQDENRVPAFSKYLARFCAECEKPFRALAEKVFTCKGCAKRRYDEAHPYVPVVRSCEQCGSKIIGRGVKYCSKECQNLSPIVREARSADRKAGKLRRRGKIVKKFNPISVLERDGWRCQICGVSTPKSRRGTNHHNAPELDHIQPLSKNGEHSIENTQCACRACNGLKSNVLVIGQIGLFSADAIAKAGVRKRGVKKWEKAASA